jgi:hypothetical protein
MLFPYLLFDECFNDQSAEPQVAYILSAEPRENNLRPTIGSIRADKGSSALAWSERSASSARYLPWS